MDQKTEQLRDIFIDLADEDTVTERQEESPGTLTEEDGSTRRQALDVINHMQERYEFETQLEDETLLEIAEGFYEDLSDTELADQVALEESIVFQARLDLHLVREEDREGIADFRRFQKAVGGGASDGELADRFEVDSEVVPRFRAVAQAERAARGAGYRYRDEFNALLGDGELQERLTEGVQEDGLEDATEGLEVNTGF